MNRTGLAATAMVCVTAVILASKFATGGEVSPPPGAVAPTMRTLEEIYDAVQAGGGTGSFTETGPVTGAEAREECFIRIMGIDGDDTVAGQTKVMRVLSVQGGVGIESAVGGAGTPQGFIEPFVFEKRVDKATPALMHSCTNGTVLSMVTISWVRNGAVYATIKLEPARIESALVSEAHNGSGGFAHLERLEVSTTKVTYQYESDPARVFEVVVAP